jgi:hypothetical protein
MWELAAIGSFTTSGLYPLLLKVSVVKLCTFISVRRMVSNSIEPRRADECHVAQRRVLFADVLSDVGVGSTPIAALILALT